MLKYCDLLVPEQLQNVFAVTVVKKRKNILKGLILKIKKKS